MTTTSSGSILTTGLKPDTVRNATTANLTSGMTPNVSQAMSALGMTTGRKQDQPAQDGLDAATQQLGDRTEEQVGTAIQDAMGTMADLTGASGSYRKASMPVADAVAAAPADPGHEDAMQA